MYSIVVKGKFDAAHSLPGVETCERLHGHTFQVETRISSLHLNNQDMVVDFRVIKECWKKYDHQSLNDFFDMPTAECLSRKMYDDLAMQGIPVVYVRVWESQDCYVEYWERMV